MMGGWKWKAVCNFFAIEKIHASSGSRTQDLKISRLALNLLSYKGSQHMWEIQVLLTEGQVVQLLSYFHFLAQI